MTFSDRKKEMLGYFSTNLLGISDPQIVWDGVANEAIDKDIPWISVSIQPTIANIVNLNRLSKRVRHVGLFIVQIFIKPNRTTEQADILVDAVGSALEGSRSSNGVIFTTTNINRVGVTNGYYQINTFTRYKYDDVRNI